MGDACSHFTQRTQAGHLRQAGLLLLSPSLGARALPGRAGTGQQSADERPCQPCRPGPVSWRQGPPAVQGKGLSDGSQRFAQVERPTHGKVLGLAGQQRERPVAQVQGQNAQ